MTNTAGASITGPVFDISLKLFDRDNISKRFEVGYSKEDFHESLMSFGFWVLVDGKIKVRPDPRSYGLWFRLNIFHKNSGFI